MTHEELLSLLSQAEEHTNTGNYGEAERLANKVLAELDKIPNDCFTLSVGEGRGEDMIRFIPRGEIDIKGKGMMKTYFFERTS